MRAKEDELRSWKENKVYRETKKRGTWTINETDNDKKDNKRRGAVESKINCTRF